MNRREALTLAGRGGAAGLVAATAVMAVQRQPIEAPAAEHDPFLDLVREYRTQLAIYNASGNQTTEEDWTLATVTIDPPWYCLRDECPVPTTMEGAIEGVRLLHDELQDGGSGGFELGVLAALVTYFDGRAA